MLFVVYRVLVSVSCLLFDVRFAVRCVLFVVCYMPCVLCCLCVVPNCALFAVRGLLFVVHVSSFAG